MSFKEINVKELYINDENLREEDVNVLVQWLEKQPHLPKASELLLALFLHSCYYSIEAAKSTIDIFFTVRTLCPEIHRVGTVKDPNLISIVDSILVTPLPKKTPSGDVVIFAKLMSEDSDIFNLAYHMKLFDIVALLHLHQYGPGNGIHLVVDVKHLTFGHFLKISPLLLKKFLYYLQEGLPVRIKSFQFVNIVPIVDKLMAMVRPFLKKELLDVLSLHQGVDPVYEHIPKDIFPKEYGGSSLSLSEFKEQVLQTIADAEEFLKFQDTQLVDESKRSGKPKDINEIFGVEGSFKKLDID